ncbi:Conserved hypothetical protein CHP02231 [Pleurotus pulmonarius]
MIPLSQIRLVCGKDGKIDTVRLFPSRAEVSRRLNFNVKPGRNNIVISGLPRSLLTDSVKIETNGGSISEISTSSVPVDATAQNHPDNPLEELLRRREAAEALVQRCNRSSAFLDKYMESVASPASVAQSGVTLLEEALAEFSIQAASIDGQLADAKRTLKAIQAQISSLRGHVAYSSDVDDLQEFEHSVQMILVSESEAATELLMTYGVTDASWAPEYELRASTTPTENQVILLYKASIKQSTGESWDDVSLILETNTPSFDTELPTLDPWIIKTTSDRRASQTDVSIIPPPPRSISGESRARSRSRSRSRSPPPGYHRMRYRRRRDSQKSVASRPPVNAPSSSSIIESIPLHSPYHPPPTLNGYGPYEYDPARQYSNHNPPTVTIVRGPRSYYSEDSPFTDIYTAYIVPDKVSVPSSGNSCNVTITRLEFDTKLSWITVPKRDTRVHMQATVRNDSEFILIPGQNSVYVDGNFVGNVSLPAVYPQDTFDCPLGIDTAIRVNYHPQTKRVSKAGFLQRTKAVIHEYSQQLTITNSRRSTVPELIVIDQIPKAEDPRISVKLLNPSLGTPSPRSSSLSLGSQKPPSTVEIDANVSAQWFAQKSGSPELSAADSDGVDGRFSWRCVVPPQGKVHLHLQWEISVPLNISVLGL